MKAPLITHLNIQTSIKPLFAIVKQLSSADVLSMYRLGVYESTVTYKYSGPDKLQKNKIMTNAHS